MWNSGSGRKFLLRTSSPAPKQSPFVLMGAESQGMLLAAQDVEGKPVLLCLEQDVPPGSVVS